MKKIDWNRKYTTIAVYVILTACAIGLILGMLWNFSLVSAAIGTLISVLSPFIIGFVLAYLLLPIVNFFEKICFEKIKPMKTKRKLNRVLSVVISYLLLIAFLVLFAYVVVPELYSSLLEILSNLDNYAESVTAWMQNMFDSNPALIKIVDEAAVYMTDISETIIEAVLPYLGGVATGVVVGVKNIVVGLIVAFYMLLRHEMFTAQIKKITYAIFSSKTAERMVEVTNLTNKAFSGYVSGQLIDSVMIAIITYLVMLIFGWPYPMLIAVIIGVTNILPFFGPFIGGIPSFIIILLINPWQAISFGIFIIILQQIDGNIIAPRILSKSVGMSAIWVVFAIIVGGGLFGFIGMVLGVPMFSVIYTLFKEFISKRLEKKNLSSNTNDYKKV
ncbi:MAG: AI-2E family transporter [Oscillospiraceae bacterium]|nr:AI-2E family transporter [Oscillospiraceae bacterium]